jgi:aspartyl-tRNA(Asn)/glutamyl-tRNA(Gln) amidotransferase subunit C
MSALTPEEISHLAKLARISLSDEEQKQYSNQLPEILNFVDQLEIADTRGYGDLESGASIESLRDDKVDSDSLTLEQLQNLAPYWQNDQVEVPPVFGESDDV